MCELGLISTIWSCLLTDFLFCFLDEGGLFVRMFVWRLSASRGCGTTDHRGAHQDASNWRDWGV